MLFSCLNALMPLWGLSFLVLAHIIIFRFRLKKTLLEALFFAFWSGLAFVCYFSFYVYLKISSDLHAIIWNCIANALTYVFLSYCYFHFINLGETARRIRILRELQESINGLTMEDILARYNSEEIIERRLIRLIESSQVIVKDDHYLIGSPLVLYMAKALIFLKMVLLGKKSEFEI